MSPARAIYATHFKFLWVERCVFWNALTSSLKWRTPSNFSCFQEYNPVSLGENSQSHQRYLVLAESCISRGRMCLWAADHPWTFVRVCRGRFEAFRGSALLTPTTEISLIVITFIYEYVKNKLCLKLSVALLMLL